MKWYYQIIIFAIILGVVAAFTYIYQWIKYQFWSLDYELIQKKLGPIWNKAGVIEIVGGAETGKTLSIILLTKNLYGRKWNNVPNTIEGCQDLKLNTLRKIWMGEFEDGLVGSNNVLLIDESWLFFSEKNCQLNNFSHKQLSSLFYFLSETSKTGFKIFYVNKLGAQTQKAFDLLSANKSAQIRTLGVRRYCEWFTKTYYYLDVEFTLPSQFNEPSPIKKPKKVKRLELKKDHFIKKSFAPYFPKRTIISLPFTSEDLDLYDKTWNLDNAFKRQKAISIMDKLAADVLIETCRYKQSRSQKLMAENEILMWWKRHPDPNRIKEMKIRGWMIAKKRGLYKPVGEKLDEEEKELKKSFELGRISQEEYQEKINKIFTNRVKLAIKIEEVQETKNEAEKGGNPFEKVSIKGKVNKEENE